MKGNQKKGGIQKSAMLTASVTETFRQKVSSNEVSNGPHVPDHSGIEHRQADREADRQAERQAVDPITNAPGRRIKIK